MPQVGDRPSRLATRATIQRFRGKTVGIAPIGPASREKKLKQRISGPPRSSSPERAPTRIQSLAAPWTSLKLMAAHWPKQNKNRDTARASRLLARSIQRYLKFPCPCSLYPRTQYKR